MTKAFVKTVMPRVLTLVTRPEPDGGRTAEALRKRGIEPVLSPVAMAAPLPGVRWHREPAAVAATSARAITLAPTAELLKLQRTPFFAVGHETAATARNAGFQDVRIGAGGARELAALILRDMPPCPVLFLAGEARKQTLERILLDAGYDLEITEIYRMMPADALSERAVEALRGGELAAALHFSRQAARGFVRLCGKADVLLEARSVQHCCLSADVAEGLRDLAPSAVVIAETPTEAALLRVLEASFP
jgi:uroporphyrinogen-III synthase